MKLLYATDVRTAAITCPLLRVHLGRVRGGVTVRDGPIYWGTVEPRWEGRVLVVEGTRVVIPVPDDSRLRPQMEVQK